MKKTLFLALFGVLLTSSLFAQRDETLFQKLKFTGAWGGNVLNVSQLNNEYVTLQGGYGGLEFGKDLFIGFGGFRSIDDLNLVSPIADSYDLDYGGLLIGYSPRSYKTVHFQTNVLLGGGDLTSNATGVKDNFLVVQPAAGIEINVFRWFRVGLNGGYRVIVNEQPTLDALGDFSNAFGEVRFKFGWSWGR